jgi:peptidoglycan/xylan/chitin deacetylase (PgdA/CDA1 family)
MMGNSGKLLREHLRDEARAAVDGLRASRECPELRPACQLAALGETPIWMKLLARSPISPVVLLGLPLRLAEQIAILRAAALAAGGWAQLESEFGARCPVLLYHHVGPHREGTYRSLSVTAEQFARQMGWLVRHGYTGITPRTWLEWLRTGKGLPNKPVMVTFDDSYADIAEFALPVLRKHGFGGAVYAVTGRLAATNTWDEAEGSGTFALMTAETVRKWATEGIEFGGHSRTHAHLPRISAEACRAEVAGSKSDLEAIIGAEVASFAYPYGQYNDSVVALTRGMYAMAFSTVEGINTLATDQYLLRRIYVGPSQSLTEFGWNVRRGRRSSWMDELRVKLGLRTRLRKWMRAKA